MKLLSKDEVRFAGYRIPHPLSYYVELKVFLLLLKFQIQTDNANHTPKNELINVCNDLVKELEQIKKIFKDKYDDAKRSR